jgi:hypothetical protein
VSFCSKSTRALTFENAHLQRDYDKLKSSGSFDFSMGGSAPAPAPAGENVNRTLDVDGATQIVVQCGGGGGADDAQRAHLQELQEKNQLLSRLAGLHEAMEKIRYVHACMHACIHTYIHTYILTYIHTYMHACIHTYIHTYIHT